ncbi:hypothetical protein DXG01_011334 [Tephrocybe rancida]|nr:hypothetical protein DXG01_011334 [Tephrocybe rancida]
MAKAIDRDLKSLVERGGIFAGRVQIVIHLQVQPWRVSSALLHESALAVCIQLFMPAGSRVDKPIHSGSTDIAAKVLALLSQGKWLGPRAISSLFLTSLQLFEKQREYGDAASSKLTPIQIRKNLAALARQVIGTPDTVGQFNDIYDFDNLESRDTEALQGRSEPYARSYSNAFADPVSFQLNFRGSTAFTICQLSYGMTLQWRIIRSRAT